MTQQARHPITLKPVLYQMAGTDAVRVASDVPFTAADGSERWMDIYRPPDAQEGSRPPVVVLVEGYPDEGAHRVLGCRYKDMASTVSWARLMAASGMASVAYTALTPTSDIVSVLAHLRAHGPSLGIDGSRIGLWVCSGNVPVALSALIGPRTRDVACAAMWYGYMLDSDGLTGVADAARTFGFINACEGQSMDNLASDVPLLVVRAGKDEMPGLNVALDRFVTAALARNLPISVVNHADGPHAFDLMDASDMSRQVVRQTLAFLAFHLRSA